MPSLAVIVLLAVACGGGWSFAARLARRTDRRTIGIVRRLGGAGETEVSFHLHLPTRDAAERAAVEAVTLPIVASAHAVRIEPTAFGARWLCVVSMHAMPTDALVARVCEQLEPVAIACGGQLDGWDVAIAR